MAPVTQSHRTATPSTTTGPLFQELLDTTSPGSLGSFPQADTAPQPTPFLKPHSPSSRSSQSSTTQMYWKGSALWDRRKRRMDLMGPDCEQTS